MKKLLTLLTLTASITGLSATELNLDGKTIQLESVATKNCMQLETNNNEEGTKLIQAPCSDSNLQQLNFNKSGDNYTITLANGEALTVAQQSKSNGVNLVQSSLGNEFKLIQQDEGFNLQSTHSNKFVSTTSYNTDIVQEGNNRLAHQLWNFYSNKIYKSCKEILKKGIVFGDGQYIIDPDGEGNNEPFKVYCDMTTDGGGWTEIIKDSSTTLSDLAKFGNTSNISETFYSDSSKGIGWGTNDRYYKEFHIKSLPFNEIKITISGNYNNPSGGLGILLMGDSSNQGKYWDQSLSGTTSLRFEDGDEDYTRGQYLTINSEKLIFSQQIDLVNQTYQFSSYSPYINMAGYFLGNKAYPHTKRYINKLLVR